MSRVKIAIPAQNPLYKAIIPIRISDVNYGGHVGNDSMLSIFHETRLQMLRHYGHNELNAAGNSLIMADVMIAYKGESFYGDILEVAVYATELTTSSFDLLYFATTAHNGAATEIAQGKTGMVCFDYSTRKIARMTDGLRALLETGNR